MYIYEADKSFQLLRKKITQITNVEMKKLYIYLFIKEYLAITQLKDFVIAHFNEIARIITFTILNVHSHLVQRSPASKLIISLGRKLLLLCEN